MTTKAKQAELEAIAQAVVLPEGATDLVMVVHGTEGARLPSGHFSGVGGSTQFGPAWLMDGLKPSAPIALFDNQKDARALFALIAGPEGELWARRERRQARIEEMDAAEAAAEAAAKQAAKDVKIGIKQAARQASRGSGSSRPAPSSEKRSASTRMRLRVEEQARSLTA